ncbi:hypothetical protein Tco_0304593 [Tanacetum coccineum]
MAWCYQNPFYLKQAQQKQQSLYNGKVLLEKHDTPAMYDSEDTLQLAQESRDKSDHFSQPHVITKKVVNSDSNGFSSTGVDITTKTRRPQPRSNTKNDRVFSASKSIHIKNKEVEIEEHPRNLLLSKNKKHMSSECNNVKLSIRNDKSEIVCAMCKQCLITANRDVCVLNYVNGMNSHGFSERLASPKPSKPRMCLKWSPTGKMFDIKGNLIASSESNGDNACTSNSQEPTIKRFPNSTSYLGRSFWEPFAMEMIMLLQFWVSVIFNGEIF